LCGPPKVGIFPSARKRIFGSRCTGNCRIASIFFSHFELWDLRRKDFAVCRVRGFCSESEGLSPRDFTSRLGGRIRLSSGSWPSGAFRISKRVKHTAVQATQDAAHKIERAICHEVSSVNCCAIDVRREKLEQSTSHTLSVGEDGSANGGRTRQPAFSSSALATSCERLWLLEKVVP
jgi:hypothetical protein